MAAKNSIQYIRTQIENLFPDNTTQEITAQDLRDFFNILVNNLQHELGLISISTPATSQALTTTAQKIIGFQAESNTGDAVTASFIDNKFTVNYDGIYNVSGRFSIKLAANTTLKIYTAINGVLNPVASSVQGAGANKPVQINFPHLPVGVLSANDVIEFYCEVDSNTNITIVDAACTLTYEPLSDYTT